MDSSPQPPLFPDRRAVRHLLAGCRRLWKDADTSPPLERAYTPPEQRVREAWLRRFLAAIVTEVQARPNTSAERMAAQQQVILLFADFARETTPASIHPPRPPSVGD